MEGVRRGAAFCTRPIPTVSRMALLSPALSSLGGRRGRKPCCPDSLSGGNRNIYKRSGQPGQFLPIGTAEDFGREQRRANSQSGAASFQKIGGGLQIHPA